MGDVSIEPRDLYVAIIENGGGSGNMFLHESGICKIYEVGVPREPDQEDEVNTMIIVSFMYFIWDKRFLNQMFRGKFAYSRKSSIIFDLFRKHLLITNTRRNLSSLAPKKFRCSFCLTFSILGQINVFKALKTSNLEHKVV